MQIRNPLSSLLLVTAAAIVALSCGSNSAPSFSFIVTSDTHYARSHQYPIGAAEQSPRVVTIWKSSERTFGSFLATLRKQVNEVSPRPVFWLSTGDLVHAGHFGADMSEPIAVPDMKRVYRDLLEDLEEAGIGVPLINAKGNNEGKGTEALDAYREIFLPYMAKNLNQELQKTYFSFDHSNAHFVVLDEFTKDLFERYEELPFDLGQEQLDWLRWDLERSADKDHIFLFHHTPVIPPIRGGFIHFKNQENREQYLKLLLEHNVRVVFVGHNHSLGLVEYEEKDGAFVQVMSNSRNLEKPKAEYIRTVYDPADLKGHRVPVSGDSILEIAQRFAPHVKRFYHARHLPGHLVVTVEGDKVAVKAFRGTTQEQHKEWMISRDPKTGRSTVAEPKDDTGHQ